MDLSQPVDSLMTPAPITIGPDATLTDAWTEMLNGGFHHLPVVAGGRLVGVISASDVMRAIGVQDPVLRDTGVVLDTSDTVRDLMTTDVTGVTPDMLLGDAVRLFARGAYHSLPVVSEGRLVGILTTTDILRALLASSPDYGTGKQISLA